MFHNLQLESCTFATGNGVFNTDTGASTYDITVALDYCIRGKAYSKATVSNGTTPTADGDANTFSTLATNKACVLVWTLDTAGTVDLWQSNVVDFTDAGDYPDGLPQFPVIDFDTYCPFGYTVLSNASTGSTFTIGSSNWDATGATATDVDVLVLPDRPQSS